MPLLKRLERLFGRFAIHHLALYLIIGQAGAFALIYSGRLQVGDFELAPYLVREGQPWRLLTFLFVPPNLSIIWVGFSWYLFYLMGNALEGHWGTFRFNLFLMTGYVLTVGAAFLHPYAVVDDWFLAGTVYLAFAHLFPDFELAIFFILPVKIKWLALLVWIGFAYRMAVGGAAERLTILAATGNFFLFFSQDLWLTARAHSRKMSTQAERFAQAGAARHRCRICGKTERTNPEMDFRYCSKCAGAQCYCPEHISQHEHVLTDDGENRKN